MDDAPRGEIALPEPARVGGSAGLAEVLADRRSERSFAGTPLSDAELGQLAWAAQGASGRGGLRTAPSAGALYPLELYVATAEGLYRYETGSHTLKLVEAGDLRSRLRSAALGQEAAGEAPAVFALTGVVSRTAKKYGSRAERYVYMEAGHAAQNLLLQATALGLAGVPIGAFDDDRLGKALGLGKGERPLYVLPVGRPK